MESSEARAPRVGARRFFAGAAFVQAAPVLVMLVSEVIFARSLPPAENGRVQQHLLTMQLVCAAATVGLPAALQYYVPGFAAGAAAAIARRWVLLLAMCGTAVWLPMLGVVRHEYAAAEIQAGILAAWFGLAAFLVEPALLAQRRPDRAALASGLGMFVCLGFLLVSIAMQRISPTAGLMAFAAGALVRLVVGLVILGPYGTQDGTAEIHRSIATYCLPLVGVTVLDALSTYGDRVLVSSLFADAPWAVYRYGAREVPFLGILVGAVAPLLFAEAALDRASGVDSQRLRLLARVTAVRLASLLFPAAFALCAVAPLLFTKLYGEAFAGSAQYFRIYLVLLPLRCLPLMPLLLSQGRSGTVLWGSVVEVIISLGGGWIGVMLTRQPSAAAWAYVAATVVQMALYLSAVRSGWACSWRGLLPWSKLFQIGVLALLGQLPALSIRAVVAQATPAYVVATLLGAGVSMLVAYRRFGRWESDAIDSGI